MARVVVRLEQHTPMIHFQHDQKNASLRASELKPKLDKYLLKLYDLKEFKIGETNALDYKVKVKSDCKETIQAIGNKSYPCYFANLSKENKNKELVKYNWIELDFFSYYDTLTEKIIKSLPGFLQENNFGTRQSKGFGSFYISEEFNKEMKLYSESDLKFDDSWRWFEIECNEKELFTSIELFYKTLRSGINLKDKLYFKSFIATYAYSKGIQWEKKTIKEELIIQTEDNQKSGEDENILKHRIVKDIMGLSTLEKWGTEGTIEKKSKEQKEQKENGIERFKSPIIFKPIKKDNKFKVYFKATSINSRFLDYEFIIKKDSDSITLRTVSEFDFEEFFNFAFQTELKDYMKKHSGENANKYMKSREFKKIEQIYEQLKEQMKGE